MNFVKTLIKTISDGDFDIELLELAGQNIIHIKTDDSKILIGKRGDNLRQLNHIAKQYAKRMGFQERFLLDINEYEIRKIKDIIEKAELLARRARTLQYDVEMPAMSAYERLIVHGALSKYNDLETKSHGEGKDRRLVIKFVPLN